MRTIELFDFDNKIQSYDLCKEVKKVEIEIISGDEVATVFS